MVDLDRPVEASTATKTVPELKVDVFEMDHCPYCRDFRDFYLPRLEKDFGHRVKVSFHDAQTASWVERTPTIAIQGGVVFEGLPREYDHLYQAIFRSLSERTSLTKE